VLRYFLLSAQYRGPINFSRDLMDAAKAGLERMQNCKELLKHLQANGADGDMTEAESQRLKAYDAHKQKFIDSMDDDLNTADAISAVFELVADINKDCAAGASKAFAKEAFGLLDELTAVLGLLRHEKKEEIDEELQKLIDERTAARAAKDWATADRIRDELAARGITLKDTPQGVQIIRA